MSESPRSELPAGKVATGAVEPKPSVLSCSARPRGRPGRSKSERQSASQPLSSRRAGAAWPHGYTRWSAPRAASSHSASVGRRALRERQKASACDQSTQLIGWLSRSVRAPLQYWL